MNTHTCNYVHEQCVDRGESGDWWKLSVGISSGNGKALFPKYFFAIMCHNEAANQR